LKKKEKGVGYRNQTMAEFSPKSWELLVLIKGEERGLGLFFSISIGVVCRERESGE